MFNHLFTPLTMGNVTLPNRISFLAHRTNFAKGGRLDERHVAYYGRRAQGGCGLIFVGDLAIHSQDRPWEAMIEAYHPEVVEDYRRLTRAVHEYETSIFAQLNHHGFQSSGAITRHAVWGPSPVADIVFGETAKPMEPEDITEVVDAFTRSAVLVREGGFDGIEIDMGPGSLLRQFLSPLSNHRQDEYGGSPENRMRFPLGVIEAVRKGVGEDFAVGVRLCADEKFWGAITTEESREFATVFEKTGGVDFINVSVGTYYNLHLVMPTMHTPFGFTIETAEQIKGAVNIPVIASHQIGTPHMADDIIGSGKGDAVGFVRDLICDPDWPGKALAGKTEDIRYCVKDNQGCIGRVNQSKTLSCIQNPSVGYEKTGPMSNVQHPTTVQKRVIVVGAGPAGLEAARAAAEKGHAVTVYEKKEGAGGQLTLARKGAGRDGVFGVIRYLKHMLEKQGVPIITGKEVTPALIDAENPDAVIIATGSKPNTKPLPGEYGPPSVLSIWDIFEGDYPIGEKVLFLDENGGHHATATVEMLADQGKKVDMVTSDLFIGIELAPIGDLYLTRQRLLQKGVSFTTDVRVEEIQGTLAKAREIHTNEPILYEGYETLVLDMGNEVEDRLYRELKGHVKELLRVGDCVAPRGIEMAVFEGRKAGESL